MTTSRRLRQAPLSSAAAWILSQGPWRRSGHGPATSAASPGRPGGSAAASAGAGWDARGAPGGRPAGSPRRWVGEEAPPAPGDCVPSPGAAGARARRGGEPLARVALVERERRRLQGISKPRLGWSGAYWGKRDGGPALTQGRAALYPQRHAGKNRGLGIQQVCSFLSALSPRGGFWVGGEGRVRGALGVVAADRHC